MDMSNRWEAALGGCLSPVLVLASRMGYMVHRASVWSWPSAQEAGSGTR